MFDLFNTDGFLGNLVPANLTYKPRQSRAAQIRFGDLNGSVSRYYRIALSDGCADDPDRERRQSAAQARGPDPDSTS